jgi:predicted AlkP superfamily phosphohydrolase/phosphomutase
MENRSKLKTMIIGLDGATFDVIQPYIREKKLPTFARLLEEGAWGELESTVPPVTAAAWTSFMTGENPGKHGIVNFTKARIDGNSEDQFVTTRDFAGRTFFDLMSEKGMRVGAITVPVTYPPWDINGIMISGFPCPDNDKVYCLSNDISINIEEPLNFSADYYKVSTEEQIIEDCLHSDTLRSDLSFDLLDKHQFDCFVLILGGIDRAQHDYWKYYDPQYPDVPAERREKFRNSIFRNYKLADDQIAKFLEIYGENSNLFIISDHGSGRHPFHFFNTNLWLKHHGWLKLNGRKAFTRETLKRIYHYLQYHLLPKDRKIPRSLLRLRPKQGTTVPGVGGLFEWEHTRAFHYPLIYPAGGIVINIKGRQVTGTVNPGEEYEILVDDIIKALLEYRDEKSGEKVVKMAVRREELYDGPYVNDFPDIMYLLNPEYESGRALYGTVISPVYRYRLSKKSGLHRMNGIFIACGPDIKPRQIQGAGIIDVAPTVLYSTGLPVPKNMDGVVLKEIFEEVVLKNRPVTYTDWKGKTLRKESYLDGQESEQVEDKLRSLGYI